MSYRITAATEVSQDWSRRATLSPATSEAQQLLYLAGCEYQVSSWQTLTEDSPALANFDTNTIFPGSVSSFTVTAPDTYCVLDVMGVSPSLLQRIHKGLLLGYLLCV